MAEAEPTVSVIAEQVATLRWLTDLPWMDCKRFLGSLTPAERERYIAAAESQPGGISPSIRTVAARQTSEHHQRCGGATSRITAPRSSLSTRIAKRSIA